jgi:hypothetical protein
MPSEANLNAALVINAEFPRGIDKSKGIPTPSFKFTFGCYFGPTHKFGVVVVQWHLRFPNKLNKTKIADFLTKINSNKKYSPLTSFCQNQLMQCYLHFLERSHLEYQRYEGIHLCDGDGKLGSGGTRNEFQCVSVK